MLLKFNLFFIDLADVSTISDLELHIGHFKNVFNQCH